VVACLYLLVLMALTCPVIALVWSPLRLTTAAGVYLWWPYWVGVAVMFLCQVTLLLVPVRALSRRPVSRRPLVSPVLASGFMMAVLVVAALGTAWEMRNLVGKQSSGVLDVVLLLALPLLAWLMWGILFYDLNRRRSVEGAVAAQGCTLLTGSILELLVAVPTHVVARNRNDCCGGFGTFVGITLGVSVMLFAFGPAVFFLYLDRWRRLHAPRGRLAALALDADEEQPADAWKGPTSW
jgi:hypothetical protein